MQTNRLGGGVPDETAAARVIGSLRQVSRLSYLRKIEKFPGEGLASAFAATCPGCIGECYVLIGGGKPVRLVLPCACTFDAVLSILIGRGARQGDCVAFTPPTPKPQPAPTALPKPDRFFGPRDLYVEGQR